MRLRSAILTRLTLALMLAAPALGAPAQTAEAPATPSATPAFMTLDEVGAGQLMLRTDTPGRYLPAPLVSTDIDIAVTGPILRATVTQRFLNPADAWVEGIYAFPLPENSAVDGLRMRIGDRFIEGRIEEREEARRVYEEAREAGQRAALVEQERPNLFTNSVANIGPGEAIVAQITFQQALEPRDGQWELRMPLVVAPRYAPDPVIQLVEFGRDGWQLRDPVPDRERIDPAIADPRSEPLGTIRNPVELTVDLAPGFAIAGVESLAHEVTITAPDPDRREIALTGPVPADRDFVLRWQAAFDEAEARLFLEPTDEGQHMLLMLAPPAEHADTDPRPREVIFVQDISGSMTGASIEQARAGLVRGLERLRRADRFNIIVFNDQFAAYVDRPIPASAENVANAIEAVSGLVAEGGTEMYPALDLALTDATPSDERLRQVIFLTDGAVGNEAEMLALIGRKLGRSRLFTVGIGSAPNSFFMRRAAEMGRGAHVYIGALDEVEARMAELFAKIENPAITDLSLDLPEGLVSETYPTPLPDLYSGAPLTLALRMMGEEPPRGTARLIGQRAGAPWQLEVPLDEALPRPGVAKLWAREKIASLEALRFSPDLPAGSGEAVDAELLDTALAYGLVSRLTSLVAVDLTPARPEDSPLSPREVALNLPDGWDPAAFLFEEGETVAVPLIEDAVLRQVLPATPPDAADATAEGAPVPRGSLGFMGDLWLGLLLLIAGGLAFLLAGRRAGPLGG